jgi:hypothetical protein
VTVADAITALARELSAGAPVAEPPLDKVLGDTDDLIRDVEIRSDLPRPVLQWALARHGLHGRTAPNGDGASVRLEPETVVDRDDLQRLSAALLTLAAAGAFAAGPLGRTSSEGWALAEEAAAEGTVNVYFWNHQSHEAAIDLDGALVDDLHVQWAGDAELFGGAITDAGFAVKLPTSTSKTIVVRPMAALDGDDDYHVLERELLGHGWKVRADGQLGYQWDGPQGGVFVAKGEGTHLRIGNPGGLDADIDYAGDLQLAIGGIDDRRDALAGDGALDALRSLASIVRAVHLYEDGMWRKVGRT